MSCQGSGVEQLPPDHLGAGWLGPSAGGKRLDHSGSRMRGPLGLLGRVLESEEGLGLHLGLGEVKGSSEEGEC